MVRLNECHTVYRKYKLAAPRKGFYLATFFSIHQTSFAPKSGWGMLVYAPGWSLPSQFWSYTPPKKLVSPRPKTIKHENFPHWKPDAHGRTPTLTFEKKSQTQFFLFLHFDFRLFLSEILSRRSRLSRTTSDLAQKSWKFQAKIAFFLFSRRKIWHNFVFVTPISTFANIKDSLPTNSTTPDRLRS